MIFYVIGISSQKKIVVYFSLSWMSFFQLLFREFFLFFQ